MAWRHPTRAASFPTTLTPPVTLLQFIAQLPAPGARATGTVLVYYVMCHTLTGHHDTCTVTVKGFLICNGSTKATTESIKCKYNKGDVNGGTKMGGSRVAPLDDLQMSEAAISPDKVTFSHAPNRGASAKVI